MIANEYSRYAFGFETITPDFSIRLRLEVNNGAKRYLKPREGDTVAPLVRGQRIRFVFALVAACTIRFSGVSAPFGRRKTRLNEVRSGTILYTADFAFCSSVSLRNARS